MDRGGFADPHDREFVPIREPRDRSRDRSLERGLYLEEELYGRSARQSPNPMSKFLYARINANFFRNAEINFENIRTTFENVWIIFENV